MGGEDNFLREERRHRLFSILKEAQTFLCFTKRGHIIFFNVFPRFGFSKLSLFGENFHTTARNVCLSSVSLCLCLSIQPFLQLSVSDSACDSLYVFVCECVCVCVCVCLCGLVCAWVCVFAVPSAVQRVTII